MAEKTSDLTGLIEALARANAEALSSAMADHHRKTDPTVREMEYPAISPLNPLGEREHPRPEIDGEVFFVGWRMDAKAHTLEEIELINQVKPGVFYVKGMTGDQVRVDVIDMEPGLEGHRKLFIRLPHTTPDERARLPHSLVSLLGQCVEQAKARTH